MRARLVAALVLLASVGTQAAKEHVAERFDVTATVQADGSLDVVEEIAFRFTGGTYTEVTRELRATETDGIDVIEASMDGVVLAEGEGEGQVEIDRDRTRARIDWHFAPTVDRVRVFKLRYRYRGVVRHGESEDWFRWPPFPSRFDYPIESGTVKLTWPAGAALRRPAGIEGPVTSSSAIDNGVMVTVANYRQREADVRMTVRFEQGVFVGAEPEWERSARRADRMAPAFAAAGAMIGAATVLGLWLFFLRYRREEVHTPETPVMAPPDHLPPAIAGSISTGRVNVALPQLLAALFDLARRGVIHIDEEQAGGFLTRHRFTLRRGSADHLKPHETAVLDALFKPGVNETRFDRALQRMATRASRIKPAIQAELVQEHFIDADRKEGATALSVTGGIAMALGIVLTIVVAVAGMPFGGAALFVPGAIFVAGLVMLICGASFSTLSTAGLRAAKQWDAYRRHLKAEFKQKRVPSDGEAIGRMLPYASSLGLLQMFGKVLEKTDVRNLPAWLRTLDAAGTQSSKAAMIALITTSGRAASRGGAGGAGGGGVGAGGSSSAR